MSTTFLSCVPPLASGALDTRACFDGAVIALRGRPLFFGMGGVSTKLTTVLRGWLFLFKKGRGLRGLIAGDRAAGAPKTGFAKDVDSRCSGLDCGRPSELKNNVDGLRRPSSRQGRLGGGGKASASVNARI